MKYSYNQQVKYGMEVFIAYVAYDGTVLESASHLSAAAARVWCLQQAAKYAEVISC